MIDIIQLVLGLFMLFLAPGLTLVNAIFPREKDLDAEHDTLYRLILGCVLSIMVFIFIGFFLSAISDPGEGERGLFTVKYLWLSTISLSLVFFVIGWQRGAYPSLGRIHPSLMRLPPKDIRSITMDLSRDKKAITRRKELAAKRKDIVKTVREYDRMVRLHTGRTKDAYINRKRAAEKKLKELDKELEHLQKVTMGELLEEYYE